ncbi:MAG: hypothetical protein Q9162_003889 [Coniocarpon cinnabarinum]
MADFDLAEDLLALAGEEEPAPEPEPPVAKKSPSPPPSKSSPPSDKEKAMPAKGVARKAPKARGASAKSRSTRVEFSDEEEDEEEEPRQRTPAKVDRSGSPDSLGSGAMSESEDEAPISATTNGFADTRYPVDGKFVSHREKQDILSMPEAKREQILAERQEEIDKDNFSRQLLQRKEAAQRDETVAAEKKKRKSAAADLDDGPRKASRQKTEANDRLANYKKKREQMNEARRTGAGAERRDYEDRDPTRLFDEESDQDSEPDYRRRPTKTSAPAPAKREPELRDFERCRLGRTNFSRVCFTPGFEQAMLGCFVRVNIGMNQQSGQNVYRMTQIREIIVGKRYGMEDAEGRPFSTDQWVRTGVGNAEKVFPFAACSDSKFTEQEFERFKIDQVKDGKKVPPLTTLESRLQGIHDLLNHKWTSAEISAKVKRSGRQQMQNNRIELARLQTERRAALNQGDTDLAAKLEAEIEELEGPKLAFGNNLFNGHKANAGPSLAEQQRQQRYEAARIAEQQRQRKAEVMERKRAKMAQNDHSARNKTTTAHLDAPVYDSARSKSNTPEPGLRLNGVNGTANGNGLKLSNGNTLQVPGATNASSSENGSSQPGTPAKTATATATANGTKAPGVKVKNSLNSVIGSKRRTDDDNIAAIGIDLDIDI